jgi:hypothetical protein
MGAFARARCLLLADGVHCGTDKHQPACHAPRCANCQESSMTGKRPIALGVGLILGGQLAFAHDMSEAALHGHLPTEPLGGRP